MTISATTQGLRMGVATSSSRPTVPFDGQVISETDTDSLVVYNGTAWVGVGGQIAIFNESQASGTQGGTFTSGSYVKRTLNTTVVNNITGCSIASSVITLPAGTFFFTARAPALQTNEHKARLQNMTASTTIQLGANRLNSSSTGIDNDSIMQGAFTLATSSTIELQHRCGTTKATNGLGGAVAFGDSEIYASIAITRIQ